jgi:isopenicillin-N epimerase
MPDFASLFTHDPTFHHLNAGTRTRVPLSVLDYIDRERRQNERNPTKAMFLGYDRLWAVQKRLAGFLGASAHDLFLRLNITSAFNDFLFALPPLPAGEVLATGWEYGGTVGLAKYWAGQVGLSFRTAPLELRTDWSASALLDAVAGALKDETRVLLVSHVATATGATFPVEEIAQFAHERGVITMIDGAHAIGSLPLSLGSLAADFYGGNFHKWFLGPEGTGFGWVHPRWRKKLAWKFGGWAAATPPTFYQNFGDRDPETCRRLMPGTFDSAPFLALGEVLSFWEQHGPSVLRARQASLLDLAAQEAARVGWEPLSPAEGLGPLVCFARPAEWGSGADTATRILREAGVQLGLPEVGGKPLVRLSPGVYAAEHEVRAGVQAAAAFRA